MNVYIKLQKSRVDLQNMDLKKSGENKFAGYDYFELGDFIPAINNLFAGAGLFSQVSFTSELATLTIINTDKPDEQIIFTSPMAEANLKGCHPIQNAGAVQSYQRRYLYMTALEIVEHDALDKTAGKDNDKSHGNGSSTPPRTTQQPTQSNTQTSQQNVPQATQGSVAMISDPQIGLVKKLLKEKAVSDDDYRKMIAPKTSTKDLTKTEASKLIETISKLVLEPVLVNEEDLPF